MPIVGRGGPNIGIGSRANKQPFSGGGAGARASRTGLAGSGGKKSPGAFAIKMAALAAALPFAYDRGVHEAAITAAQLFEKSAARTIGSDLTMTNLVSRAGNRRKLGAQVSIPTDNTPASPKREVRGTPPGPWAILERGTRPHLIIASGEGSRGRVGKINFRAKKQRSFAAVAGDNLFATLTPEDVTGAFPIGKKGGKTYTKSGFVTPPVLHSGIDNPAQPWTTALPGVKAVVPGRIEQAQRAELIRHFTRI